MAESTISAGFARALLDLAVKKGASRASLARASGIDLAELGNQDNRVSFASYMALMRAGQELSGDPALALHFGEAFDIAELSIVGLIGMACETIAEAFEQLGRYTQLAIDVQVDDPRGRRLVLEHIGRELWLIDTRKNPNAFPQLTESSFARMAAAVHRARSPVDFVRAVHFTHPAPAYRAEYDRVFQLPIVFESDKNALLMAEGSFDSFLMMKSPQASRFVFGVLSERAEALLKELESSKTVRGQVERLLMPILHKGDASMDLIADRMGTTRQTLYRNLKAEGVTFERVLDDLRHRLALDYLGAKKVSVTEAAYLVGFSDPAAFSRAFKRWTGLSPSAARG